MSPRPAASVLLVATVLLAGPTAVAGASVSPAPTADTGSASVAPAPARLAPGVHAAATAADGPTAAVDEDLPALDVRLEPVESDVDAGENATFDVVVDGVTEGIFAFSINVSTSDRRVVRIVGSEVFSGTTGGLGPQNGGEYVLLGAIGSEYGNGSVTVGQVTVTGESAGVADLRVRAARIGANRDDEYPIGELGSATVTVGDPTGPSVPPVTGDDPPTNVDDDAPLEDVDGDGTFTIFDVQAFLETFDGPVVQSNVAAFDFDGDGDVDIFDVQTQLEEL
jgi:hypothetical protein